MQWKIIILLAQNFVLYSYKNFVDALIGQNVQRAGSGEFNNVVCIVQKSNEDDNLQFDVTCTGTLITRTHILTSEHCFTNMGLYSLYVLVGSVDLRFCEEFYIAWWINFEWWATYWGAELEYVVNDIAIIRLIEPVSESIFPAVLLWLPNSDFFGVEVDLVGWGRLENGSVPYGLRKAKTRIISNENCEIASQNVVGYYVPITENYLCSVAVPPAQVFAGDSGGPVFFGGFLLAVSYGTMPNTIPFGDPRRVNVHFTVTAYREFIEDTMNI